MSKLSPAPKAKHRAQKKRFAARRDLEYVAFIREQPCLIGGRWRAKLFLDKHGRFYEHLCLGAVQAAHVTSRGAGGDDHGNIVPLCLGGHDQQHTMGIRSFQARWGIDLKAEAARLYQMYLAEVGRA